MKGVCKSDDCGREIKRSKTGFCRSCVVKAKHQDLEWKAWHDERVRATSRDPERLRKLSEAGRRTNADPDIRARRTRALCDRIAHDPEYRAEHIARAARHLALAHASRAPRRRADERLAWCPPHRLAEHRLNVRRSIGAAESKRMILEDEALKEKRRRASLSPFQRQEEAISRGATIIEKVAMPGRQHGFSLMGGSLA